MSVSNLDASIGKDHRIFQISIDGSFQAIGTLFPSPIAQYLAAGRIALDGYAYSTSVAWRVMDVSDNSSDWYEDIPANSKYSFPMINWHTKSKVMSPSGPAILIVRLIVDR